MNCGDNSGDGALTDEQAEFLIRSGAMTPQGLAGAQASVASGDLDDSERLAAQQAIEQSLSAVEVATRLSIDLDEVDQRQHRGELFTFTSRGEQRYPTWQLTADPRRPVLPGLAQCITAIPEGMHPATVLGFMTTPQDDVHVDGQPATLADWLLNGGDPQIVRDAFDSYLRT